MTTTNRNELSSAGSLPADSASCEELDSMQSRITAPILRDSLFMYIGRTFSIRDLLRLKQVSKTIANLVSSNTVIATQSRWQDNTEDWYFPLLVGQNRHTGGDCAFSSWTSWSGVHHSSGLIHSLPCLTSHIPEPYDPNPFCIVGSSGGLVLLLAEDWSDSVATSEDWIPLVLSNPVTQEWRVLPVPDCRNLGMTSWANEGFLIYMIVDRRANAYKVILILRGSLCVYKSTSNTWSFWILREPIPSSVLAYETLAHGLKFVRNPYLGTSGTTVNGGLHFAELVYDGDYDPLQMEVALRYNMLTHGEVRVYEVDDDAGVWKPFVKYPLRNYILADLHREYKDYCFVVSSYMMTVVECMGGMYAIIPAVLYSQEVGEEIRRTYGLSSAQVRCAEVGIVPLRFYILRLQGSGGRAFGQLLIHDASRVLDRESAPPHNDCDDTIDAIDEFLDIHIFQNIDRSKSWWYQCSSGGSEIWISLADYVVQYNVVTGRSTTEILTEKLKGSQDIYIKRLVFGRNLAFEPSLYMKP